ncbi:MAG: DUF262 domain-containing protein [Solirubrobacteraceae bacterium]
MTATLFKEVSYSLSKLIEDIDTGEIGLPDIQRPFVWTPAKVRDLFDSMYNGFPVGYLLFWGNLAANGARQIGTGHKQAAPRLLIVDGQQRLTSLYAVVKGIPVIDDDFKESRLKVAFRPRDATFAVPDAPIERDPEFIADITQLWSKDVPRNRFVKRFLEGLRASRAVDDDEEDHLNESIDRLYDLQSYPFTALELSSTIEEEKVAEVFVRINSKGVPLNQADFILTLMSVWWDEGRKQLEDFSRAARHPSTSGPSPFNHFIHPSPDQLLRVVVGLGFRRGALRSVYALLRGKDLATGQPSEERREEQFERLAKAQGYALDITNWQEFLKVLVRAGYRGSSMLSSENALLYAYIFYLVGKRDFGVASEDLREIIARWFFMATITGRYSSSPESQVESDLARLRDISTPDEFISVLDSVIDDTLTNDFWEITLPNALATSAARSPSLYAYYAALNLLDARVLLSKMRVNELFDPAIKAVRAPIERHHLFPRAHLKKLGIENTTRINQIANMALVEWPKNTAISGEDPKAYWPSYSAALTPPELERQCFWHALPDGWHEQDYDAFLTERRHLMAKVVRAGYEHLAHGESAPVEPSLAELIAAGESDIVEFKSTARFNAHIPEADPRLELTVLKTIAGFANAHGGTLLIGVDDDGRLLGLDGDLALMKKPDVDRYQLWLTDLLETSIGKPAAAGVTVAFPDVDGSQLCRVDVRRSGTPVFLRPPGTKLDEFWVRIGNSTRLMSGNDVVTYTKQHWP